MTQFCLFSLKILQWFKLIRGNLIKTQPYLFLLKTDYKDFTPNYLFYLPLGSFYPLHENPEVVLSLLYKYSMTKCFIVEFAARHRFFRTLPHYLWLLSPPSPLHSDREAHRPFHVCIPRAWAMSGISLPAWWDPSLLAFMELIRSHLLLNIPQITENERVGPCSSIPLGKKEILPTKARGHVPHNISHFFFCLIVIC